MNLYKQALAQIIHDNGGWVSVGGYAAQDKDDSTIWFSIEKPTRRKGQNYWVGDKRDGIACDRVLSNWFCVVLSRNEYFHLHPAERWIEWKGGECPVAPDVLVNAVCEGGREWCLMPAHLFDWDGSLGLRVVTRYFVSNEPDDDDDDDDDDDGGERAPIEQLAADYRNAKDYADRKQQEADDARANAEGKLAALVAAGTALGLDISIAKGEANA